MPKQDEKKLAREPVAAGTFYPDNEVELNLMIEEFLNKAELPKLNNCIRGLIVPHAGYVYSGQVAAYGYKAIGLSISSRPIRTVVLIGNSHQEYFDGISVYEKGYFRTPLGDVEIDEGLTKKIIDSNEKITFKESAHINEHSLEVQLPFLQKVLKDFRIVPIIMGNDSEETIDILINALKNLISDNILVVASSDLSHYPKYEDARYSDNKVIDAILTAKKENLRDTVSQLEKENIYNLQTCACGQGSIEVIMGLFGDKNIKLLKYANSGDTAGDKSQVVGYAAIVFMDSISSPQVDLGLNKDNQRRLLEIAKQSLEAYIKQDKTLKFEEKDFLLNKPMGAFVTLKKHGELRGCIGVFQPNIPLYQVVAETAISSAVNDVRFMPVTKDELDELEYEISVLSPLKKVDSWKNIEIGKHGVQIRKGNRSGVFLPQVATENNWELDTFMSVLCFQKAGLASDCWKNPEIEIYVFTAQVFGEE